MKKLNLLWLLLLCPGCFSYRSTHSLVNATTLKCVVRVEFASGKMFTYKQPSGTDVGYVRKSRKEQMPVVTHLSVGLDGTDLKYELKPDSLSKLRAASDGILIMILYDDGLAVMPPEVRKNFPKTESLQEYLREIMKVREQCQEWTRKVLQENVPRQSE